MTILVTSDPCLRSLLVTILVASDRCLGSQKKPKRVTSIVIGKVTSIVNLQVTSIVRNLGFF